MDTGVVQVWECPKCYWLYQSPLRIRIVVCSRKHPAAKMKITEGELPPPCVKKELSRPKRSENLPLVVEDELLSDSRVKVGRLSNPSKLLEAFGIKE